MSNCHVCGSKIDKEMASYVDSTGAPFDGSFVFIGKKTFAGLSKKVFMSNKLALVCAIRRVKDIAVFPHDEDLKNVNLTIDGSGRVLGTNLLSDKPNSFMVAKVKVDRSVRFGGLQKDKYQSYIFRKIFKVWNIMEIKFLPVFLSDSHTPIGERVVIEILDLGASKEIKVIVNLVKDLFETEPEQVLVKI